GSDLVALSGKRADIFSVDRSEHGRDGESRLQVVALQHRKQCRQPLGGAEFGVGRLQIGGAYAVRPSREAQIDSDADAAASTLRPADVVVDEALFVRDRVAVFPRHISQLLALKRPPPAVEIFRGTSAPPPRSSGTTRRVASSSG